MYQSCCDLQKLVPKCLNRKTIEFRIFQFEYISFNFQVVKTEQSKTSIQVNRTKLRGASCDPSATLRQSEF